MRVEIVTECEHGYVEEHCADHPELAGAWHPEFWGYPPEGRCRRCSGGSRRVLEPGSYVLIEKTNGEWPWHGTITRGWETSETQALYEWLDALAEGEQ